MPISMPEYDADYLEYRVNHRLALYRRAAIYVPGAIVFTGLAVWSALGLPSTILIAALFALFAASVDHEAIQTVRDLRADPVVTKGNVGRTWKKGRFLVFGQVHYAFVQKQLFEVSPVSAHELEFGDQVEILHYPHTNMILTLRRTARAEQERVS